MLPLSSAAAGDKVIVKKVSGKDEIKKHLFNLGFVDGTVINVISSHNGDLILNVKDSRLALTKEMTEKIMIEFVSR